MDTIIDLLGAAVIAGMIMLGIANLNIFSSQVRFKSDSDLTLQTNTKTISDILDYDLRKIGYDYSGTAIITADTNKLEFYADIDSNGTVDQITYLLSNSAAVSNTENPSDKILYRVVNGDTSKGPSLGITNLKFTYKTMQGNETTIPDSIKFIKTEIWFETPTKVLDNNQEKYLLTYWEMTINPRNI
ncbi:MAG TPA: hypothetical protein VJ954_00420 [Ignavibacteriaceae bacterium]|nr:hypothetical protein [Ignavibacteriaceae bacterium]